jgi:hypothetical protein
MRIKSVIVMTLILLIFLAIAMIPLLDGMVFKRQYYNFAKALEADQRIKINIIEYHEGWFSSEAKVAITPKVDSTTGMPAAPNSTGYTTPTIILSQHISHGPLVYDAISEKRVLGLASIQSSVHLPAAIEAVLLGGQASSNGVVTINGLATLTGNDFLNQIKTPVFNINLPTLGTVVWQGLNGSINFHIAGSHLQKVTTDLTIGAVNARSSVGTVITKDANIKYDMAANDANLWDGSYSIAIPSVLVNNANGVVVSINNLNFSNTFGMAGKNLYTSKLQLIVGQLVTPEWLEFSVNQSNLNISLENLNAAGLANLLKEVSHNNNLRTTPAEEQKFIELITSVITPTTLLKQNAVVNTSFGKLITDSSTSWTGDIKTLDDLMKKIKSTANIRISMTLVNQLIELFAQNTVPPAVPAPVDMNSEAGLLKQLDTLGAQNKIDLSIAIQIKDMVQTHLSPADFTKYIEQLEKLKQLPPDIAAQLKTQYPIILDVSKNASTLAPAPVSPAESIRDQLATFVQLGYIKQDKDDYVTVLMFEKGVLKANGVEVQGIR